GGSGPGEIGEAGVNVGLPDDEVGELTALDGEGPGKAQNAVVALVGEIEVAVGVDGEAGWCIEEGAEESARALGRGMVAVILSEDEVGGAAVAEGERVFPGQNAIVVAVGDVENGWGDGGVQSDRARGIELAAFDEIGVNRK